MSGLPEKKEGFYSSAQVASWANIGNHTGFSSLLRHSIVEKASGVTDQTALNVSRTCSTSGIALEIEFQLEFRPLNQIGVVADLCGYAIGNLLGGNAKFANLAQT